MNYTNLSMYRKASEAASKSRQGKDASGILNIIPSNVKGWVWGQASNIAQTTLTTAVSTAAAKQ